MGPQFAASQNVSGRARRQKRSGGSAAGAAPAAPEPTAQSGSATPDGEPVPVLSAAQSALPAASAVPKEAAACSKERTGGCTSASRMSVSGSSHAPRPEEAVGSEACFPGGLAIKKSRCRRVRWEGSTSLLPLVPTPLACRLLQKLLWAYNSRRWGVRPPVLLHGLPGSGKSSYIRWLAQTVGVARPPVSVFLDQQTEAKDLVGSWVCGRRAGEFEWQEGILARCVREGRWIVIEQLQQLAQDVHALLHGLTTTGRLTVHEQQQQLRVHPDFALFATLATQPRIFHNSRGQRSPAAEGVAEDSTVGMQQDECLDVALTAPPPPLSPLLESWVLLHVPPPSVADIHQIAVHSFPAVAPIASRLQKAFHAAATTAAEGLARPGLPLPKAARLPQLRDFVKLCRRLQTLAAASGSSSTSIFEGFLTERLRLRVVEEAAAVLLSHLSDRALRLRAAVAFAALWDVHEEQVKALLFSQKPTLQETAESFQVGPYCLPKLHLPEKPPSRNTEVDDGLLSFGVDAVAGSATPAAGAVGAAEDLAEAAAGEELLTGQQLRLVQQAGGALYAEEPLLFVGDTGAGKTFVVSYLAERLGKELIVVNLHRQSEGEDLIGRWIPRHPPHEVAHLWRQLLQNASLMLGTPPGEDTADSQRGDSDTETRKVNKRKQHQTEQETDCSRIDSMRQMMRQVRRVGSRLLQREAYVALLRLAAAANNALLQLLRQCGNMLPVVSPTPQQQQQEQELRQRGTVGELLARCTELETSLTALLEDPALSDCSASTPRKFESLVDACGLREFLPVAGAAPEATTTAAATGGAAASGLKRRSQLHFVFTEGPLVEAVRTGKWLLLDEINLAPPDLLQRLLGLLEEPQEPLLLLEGGKPRLVYRHPDFRVFACMNPPILAPPLRLAVHKLSFEDEEELDNTDETLQQQEEQQRAKDVSSDVSAGVGKRELPAEVRQRFTELYVDETEDLEDIITVVDAHLRPLSADPPSRLVAEVYIHLKCLAEAGQLLDGNNKTPCYSLRTLSRSLLHAAAVARRPTRPLQLRPALKDGFLALFSSSLSPLSAARVERVLAKAFKPVLPGEGVSRPLSRSPSDARSGHQQQHQLQLQVLPAAPGEDAHVAIEGFIIRKGGEPIDVEALKRKFVLTPNSEVYVRRVLRLLSGSRCALLLEGPTSCGKTSMVSFLAAATGHKCIRINNHENTDIQDYVGSYAPDAEGRLVFAEGPLTLAVRHGWWVLIDELNLAPSDVLEALNRLLDSNRELILPATGEVVRAHKDFQLFGTQNPAGIGVYGGRKVLSRALANRFLQLQVTQFATEDLRQILLTRCSLPLSRVEPMLRVYTDLQQRRANSSVFFGAHGFMTIRDLIRWGRRVGNSPFQHMQQQQQKQQQTQQEQVQEYAPMSFEEVALEGWLLVGERLRTEEDRTVVRSSLERHCLGSTAGKPKQLQIDFAADPYIVAFRGLLHRKVERCLHQQQAARDAAAAAAAAAARAAALSEAPVDAQREAQATAAAAAATAAAAAAAAPELPAFLPFSFNGASLRLLALTLRALVAGENLLLVGDTGAGKTAVCELVAWTLQQQEELQGEEGLTALESGLLRRLSPNGMYVYNCHLQMEASELLGSMSPVHQGELLQQQETAAALQQQIMQMLEHPPPPEELLPNYRQLRESSAAAAATAKRPPPTAAAKGDGCEEDAMSASCLLLRFYELLQAAAADVVICLRAHRDRGGLEMVDEDTNLFCRALSKAARQAQQLLQQETDAATAAAAQKEAHLNEQVEAVRRILQREQSKHQQLLLQLQRHDKEEEEKQGRLQKQDVLQNGDREAARLVGADCSADMGHQCHKQKQRVHQEQQPHRQVQQQEGSSGRKKRRKGTRNRAERETADATFGQGADDAAPKKPRTASVNSDAVGAGATGSLREDGADTAGAPHAASTKECGDEAKDSKEDTAKETTEDLAAAVAEAAAAVSSAEDAVASSVSEHATASASAVALRDAANRAAALVKVYVDKLAQRCTAWREACKRTHSLFCWRDGPLVKAMKTGAVFLLDEASLGQDAVLERLNSLLEDGRHILLTEQGAASEAVAAAAGIAAAADGGATAATAAAAAKGAAPAATAGVEVYAAPGFRFIATMNPGGDYGKRELSPALRNRLTEVFVPAFSFEAPDAVLLLLQRLEHTCLRGLELPHAAETLDAVDAQSENNTLMKHELQQLQQLQKQQPDGSQHDLPLGCLAIRLILLLRWVRQHIKQPLSIRDALCWICFIHRFVASQLDASPSPKAAETATAKARWAVQGLMHGGCLLLLDGLGVGADMQLPQEQLHSLAQGYLEAEETLVKLTALHAPQRNEEEKQKKRLERLQQNLQQQVAEAASHPARRPHMGILLLLKTHACALYRDLGLYRNHGLAKQQWEQQQQTAGPCWIETCAGFEEDGFAWVSAAFGGKDIVGRAKVEEKLQVGPFSLAAFRHASDSKLESTNMQQQQQLEPQQLLQRSGQEPEKQLGDELPQVIQSPSVRRSLGRLLRCLLLLQQQPQQPGRALGSSSGRHAVLLEGPPGAGKTFVVGLLARLCGRQLVRINLSQDTELADLLGAVVPAADLEGDENDASASCNTDVQVQQPEAATAGPPGDSQSPTVERKRPPFVWTDGILTRSLRAGHWVLLDELNLAPQQTLEGLNPLLDHRRCVYLPTPEDPAVTKTDTRNGKSLSSSASPDKKDAAVYAPPGFVLFATQNPHATTAAAATVGSVPGGDDEGELTDAGLEALLHRVGLPADLNATRLACGSVSKLKGDSRDSPTNSKAVEGRKGLPQSLLNRFCRVRVDEMLEADMVAIAHKLLTCLEQQREQQLVRQEKQEIQPQRAGEGGTAALEGSIKVQSRIGFQQREQQQLLLSACVVRCVRLLGKLGIERPFKGLSDSVYNLRDAMRIIRLYAQRLPMGDPRGAVTVSLLSRLRSGEDLRAAAHLASLCFPPNLYQLQQQQAHDLQQNNQQQEQETVEVLFNAIGELLHPGVAPGAVLHAVQPQMLLSSMRFADTLEGRQPMDLIVTDTHVSFGDMTLARHEEALVKVREQDERIQTAQQEQQHGKLCGLLLHSQRLCVSAVAAALVAGFPVLLTGERGSGKSSIVRWLAAACGATVCEVQLGPSVDTSDLLGVYRQIQPRQRILQAADAAQQVADCLLEQHAPQYQHQHHLEDVLKRLKGLRVAVGTARQKLVEAADLGATSAPGNLKGVQPELQVRMLLQHLAATTATLLEGCDAAASSWRASLGGNEATAGEAVRSVLQHRSQRAARLLQQGCILGGLQPVGSAAVRAAGAEQDAARFEWADSALVNAVKRGHWLLLRSAHLCSASVLDRLNALLEDGGGLLLTEGGPPREVKRHPNFRILFTAEAGGSSRLSAALRNRCCEVYVRPPGTAAATGLAAETSIACVPAATSTHTTEGCSLDVKTNPRPTATASTAASQQPLLLEALTERLLRTLAALLRDVGVSAVADTGGDTALRPLLSRWFSSLLTAEAELQGRLQGDKTEPSVAAAARSTLRIMGVFISFCCSKTHCSSSSRFARLCPLLLQDSYRLLLAGDRDLSLAAAEVMSLQHAAVQLLLQLLGDESALFQFAHAVQSSLSDLGEQQNMQKQPQHQKVETQQDSSLDVVVAGLREVQADMGEEAVLSGLAGLQAIAHRVAGRSSKELTAAAAASWRCLQGWGSAYAAARYVAGSNKESSLVTTSGTPQQGSAATAIDGGDRDSSVCVETLFQCFLWQYTAALDSSAIWRVLLLQLLAASLCCSSASKMLEGSSSVEGSGDHLRLETDWAILRGAIERHVLLHGKHSSSRSKREGLMAKSVASETSFLGSVITACVEGAGAPLPLLAGAVRLFMSSAADGKDFSARLRVLQQLQEDSMQQNQLLHQRHGKLAVYYLSAACNALQETGQEAFLLSPGAAAAVPHAQGAHPNGLSLLYAASRLLRTSSPLWVRGVSLESRRSPSPEQQQREMHKLLLLRELVHLRRVECAAILMPQRLLLLEKQNSSKLFSRKCPRCNLECREFWCLLFACAWQGNRQRREPQDVVQQELMQQELMQQRSGEGETLVGEMMQRLYQGLCHLSTSAALAADGTLRMLVQEADGLFPSSAAEVLAGGLTQQCRHLTRCFSAWAEMLQMLALPVCCKCGSVVSEDKENSNGRDNKHPQPLGRQERIRIALEWHRCVLELLLKVFVERLQDFAAAVGTSGSAIRGLNRSEDVETAFAPMAPAPEFVAAELLPPLECLRAMLVHTGLGATGSAVNETGEDLVPSLAATHQQQCIQQPVRGSGGVAGAASIFDVDAVPYSNWKCLLPLQLSQHEAQTVRGWLLRELLHAAVLKGTSGSEMKAAAAAETAGSAAAGAAAAGENEEWRIASFSRRFACTAPSLQRAFDLLLNARCPTLGHASIGLSQQQREMQGQQQQLQSKPLLLHASVLHALLLSSCLLRAEGRQEAAESLEAQVGEALLPSYQLKRTVSASAAAAPSPLNGGLYRAEALRTAAVAEGLIDSRQQRWVSLSSSAVVSVGHLQAQLAAAAAVQLGLQHAAELLMVSLWLQTHQTEERRPATAAGDGENPGDSYWATTALSVALEEAAQTQLHQQQELLPIFILPPAAISRLSSEDPSSAGSAAAKPIPVPPALLDAAAVLTSALWQQQQKQHQHIQHWQRAKSNKLVRFATCAAVEVLSLMWRTELDLRCNDALGLKEALHEQQLLQDACGSGKDAEAAGGVAATAGRRQQRAAAVLTRRALAHLAETAGGLRGAAAAATAIATASGTAQRMERPIHIQEILNGSSCTCIARIVAEVQQHATVSSASACFIVLQRLKRQLQRLDKDRRRACRFLKMDISAEDTHALMKTPAAAATACVGTEAAVAATAAEWAAVLGFAAALWSFCGPQKEGDSWTKTDKENEQAVQERPVTPSAAAAVRNAFRNAWVGLARFLGGGVGAVGTTEDSARAAAKAAAEELRAVARGLQEAIEAAETAPAAVPGNAEAGLAACTRNVDAGRTAVASLVLLQQLLEKCADAGEPGELLFGATGKRQRSLLLMLLGRWAVLSAASAAAAELQQKREVTAWRQVVQIKFKAYATEREALLLRAAALDGCDGVQQDLISGIGGRTSASVALAAESEAHATALQQLLQQTSKADCLLQHLTNLLPLRAAAIPSDLALRLVPAGVVGTAVADEFEAGEGRQAEGAGTDEREAAAAAQLHVLQRIERGSVVTASPEAALTAWLESLNEFCCSTMETRKLLSLLPELAPLLLGAACDASAVNTTSPAALKTAAEAAAACSSRLVAAHPLLLAAAVRTATTGLWAVAKGLLDLAEATDSMLRREQLGQQLVEPSPVSLALKATESFPALPFATLDCESISEGTHLLQPLQRVQWLLLWLRAEATAAAAAHRKSRRPAANTLLCATPFTGARLALAGLLHQVSQKHLAWRKQREIAADETATLMQRLESLVVDRAEVAAGKRRGDAEAAEELFPCSEEWSQTLQQQQRELLQPGDGDSQERTQYTAWFNQSTYSEQQEDKQQQQKKQQLALHQLEGLTEEDLLHLWGSAVDVACAWSGTSSSSNSTARDSEGGVEATAAYREALAGSFCILLNAHSKGALAVSSDATVLAAGASAGTIEEEVRVAPELDCYCMPHMQAMLTQTASRLIGVSPLQQQRQEQQLKQLLMQDDDAALEIEQHQQSAESAAAETDTGDSSTEQQLQQERLQQQRERARKLRFSQLCRSVSLSGSTKGAATSFYAPGNPVLLEPLSGPVQRFQEAAASFAAVVEDHPVLQSMLLLTQRVAALSLFTTSPADALAALESLLDRAAAWQHAMDRHHLAHLIALHISAAASHTAAAVTQLQETEAGTSSSHSGDEVKDEVRQGSSMRASLEQQDQAAMQAAERLLQRFDAAVRAVERQVVLLRRRQLLEWRFLREFREQRMQQQSLQFAPFLWGLLPDDNDTAEPPGAAAAAAAAAVAAAAAGPPSAGDPSGVSQSLAGAVLLQLVQRSPRAVTDVLLEFLRTSPLGQFEGRLRCLEGASYCRRLLLHGAAAVGVAAAAAPTGRHLEPGSGDAGEAPETSRAEVVCVVMGAVARFAVAAGWLRAVQQQLHAARKEMDRAVSSLTSLARWDLSSRTSMRESVHKTHVQLAKHVKTFDGCLLQLMHAAVGPAEERLHEQLVAATLSLPLLSPLAAIRLAADTAVDSALYSNMQASTSPATPAVQTSVEAASSPTADSGEAAATAAVKAVGRFLSLSVGLPETVDVDCTCLKDLHPYSGNSASAADVAREVQAVCQDFIAAVKEAAAAPAATPEEQQQEEKQQDVTTAVTNTKPKRQVTRQQMQRKFAELRSMLRNNLHLPCLSVCGGDPSLFAATLNDASGLPGPPEAPHPLQEAAALHQHDTAARAAAFLSLKNLDKRALPSWLVSTALVENPTPIGDLLGDTWASAAQQWYLLLQTLLQCQQLSTPHKDVLAQRDQLLGFAAALVLHVLQQRQRCWQAAAHYQVLVDAAAVSLVSPSVSVPSTLQQGLQRAADTLQQALQQAGALLPTLQEATVQNDALNLAFAVSPPQTNSPSAVPPARHEWPEASSVTTATATPAVGAGIDENRLLRHDIRQLRSAWDTLRMALQQIDLVQQLLLRSPETRRLSAYSASAAEAPAARKGHIFCVRLRLQWLREVEAACKEALDILNTQGENEMGSTDLFGLLPSHAEAGIRKACAALHAQLAALVSAATSAQRETESCATTGSAALAKATESLKLSLTACRGASPQRSADLLLQLTSGLKEDSVNEQQSEQQQPVFSSLPVPSLECLFPFKDCIGAVEEFTRAAPAYLSQPLLKADASGADARTAATDASRQTRLLLLQTLQRAAAVVLASFDALEGTARLSLSFLQLTWVLLQLGWGRKSSAEEAAEEAAAARPEKQRDEWVSGTGLGEGEGARDISEQVEDEWQFDGLKDEQADPQQKPPDKPKTQEEDKALEVSMDFEGDAEAPPPSQNGGDREQQQEQPLENSAGQVDLQEGGQMENKRWTGEEGSDDERENTEKGENKQKETIETEGGVPQGDVEMEGAKDGNDTSQSSKDTNGEKQQQQQQSDKSPDEGDDEGRLEAPSSEGDGLEQQQAPQYQQKLRGGDSGTQEETGDAMEEVESETDETCNASSGEAGDGEQEQQQPATGEGPTDRWGDDLHLEDVALDGDEKEEGGIEEEPEAQDEAGNAEEQQENTAVAGTADGSNNAGQDSGEGENMDVDVTELQQQCVQDQEQQMHQDEASDEAGDAPDNSSAAAETQEGEEPAEPPVEGGDMETQEAREEEKAEAEDSDKGAHQDPSVQGIEAPLDGGDDHTFAAKQRQKPPKQNAHRAFGIEGEGSLVQRETVEADGEDGGDVNDWGADGCMEEGGDGAADAATAAANDGGSLSRSSGTEGPQHGYSGSSPSPFSLPNNPLEDDGAVERWLQQVQLLRPQREEMDGNEDGAAAASPESSKGEGGHAGREDASLLQRGQLCQQDEASGTHEAFAEAEETSALQSANSAKLAEADNQGEADDGEERRIDGNQKEDTCISSVVNPEQQKTPEKKGDACELSANLAGGNEECMEIDGQGEEDTVDKDEASARLLQQLEPQHDTHSAEQIPQQQLQLQHLGGAAQDRSSRDPQNPEEEEEKTKIMEADLHQRLSLDDVGKDGLSPEHAAALWHLLEGRTAAAAVSLSETLRLVLQPTANGAWEGGYRSGKKLSLRRVLAYVASSQRDDRLWLRRRRPQGFQYRVLVGIDCSSSMQQLNAASSALEAVVLLSQAFNHLQIGTVSVCTFGGPKPEVCIHPTSQVSAADGQRLLQRCSFKEESHKSHEVAVTDMLQLAIHELDQDTSSNSSNTTSMALILSDGRFNKEQARPWVNAALARGCIPLLLILDPGPQKHQQQPCGTAAASGVPAHSSSIFDLKQVQQLPGGGMEVTPYLQDFPFPYYAVVRDTRQLPAVLGDIIRQWVEAANSRP